MDKRTALLMIDMQRAYIDPASPVCIDGAAATVPACTRLIENCRQRDIPVIFVVRQYRDNGVDMEHPRLESWLDVGRPVSCSAEGMLSGELPEEFGFCEEDYMLIKPRFSAFFQTSLDMILRRLRRDTLLLAGTTTPNCIRTTCYDGIALEYNVAIVEDCTSSMNEDIQHANIADMQRIGAQVLSCDDFINGKAALADTVSRAQELVTKGI